MERRQPKAWSAEEDALLSQLVTTYGPAWKSIEQYLAQSRLGSPKSAALDGSTG